MKIESIAVHVLGGFWEICDECTLVLPLYCRYITLKYIIYAALLSTKFDIYNVCKF